MCFRRRKGTWRLIGLAAVLLLSPGCIPIPVPWYERTPLWSEAEALRFLKVGETDKDEILSRFGTTPHVMRVDGRVWVYGEEQIRGVVFLPGGPVGEKLHLLVIEFDSDERFYSLGVFEEKYGCLDSGLCFNTYWEDAGIEALRLKSADFFETPPRSRSEAVWQFEKPLEGCRVHLYTTLAPRAATQLWKLSDSQPDLQRWWLLDGPYFVATDVAPGDYRISTSTETAALQNPSSAPEKVDGSLEFTCSAPVLLFVQREVHSGLFSSDHRLRTRSAEDAIKVLRNYTLVQQPQDLGWTSGPYRSAQPGPPR